jgi:hypothetical protein
MLSVRVSKQELLHFPTPTDGIPPLSIRSGGRQVPQISILQQRHSDSLHELSRVVIRPGNRNLPRYPSISSSFMPYDTECSSCRFSRGYAATRYYRPCQALSYHMLFPPHHHHRQHRGQRLPDTPRSKVRLKRVLACRSRRSRISLIWIREGLQ